MIKFLFITSDPEIARFAVDSGAGRIFVDLEIIGKQERQGHRDTVVSHHSLGEIEAVRRAVPDVQLLVRTNPLHSGTRIEVDAAIEAGADLLMLPMFRRPEEVGEFARLVRGRVPIIPLVETAQAMVRLPAVVELSGIGEIYIGLNDLHVELGLDFMFEIVAAGLVEHMATQVKAKAIPFGFGGIARVGDGQVPGELVLSEHVRLGSSSVILSRTFHGRATTVAALRSHIELPLEIAKLRAVEARLQRRGERQIELDRQALASAIAAVAANCKEKTA